MKGCQLELGRDVFLEDGFAKGGVLALEVPVLPRTVLLWPPTVCSSRPSPGRACWLYAGPGFNCCMRDRLGRQPQPAQCPTMSWKGTGKTHTMSRQQSSQIQPMSLLEN